VPRHTLTSLIEEFDHPRTGYAARATVEILV